MISERNMAMMQLIVSGINEAIKKQGIDLGGCSGDVGCSGAMEVNILGKRSFIIWSDAGFDELLISVWYGVSLSIDKPTMTTKPLLSENKFRDYILACGSCFLERKTGKHIQGNYQFFDVYIKRGVKYQILKKPRVKPLGYELTGKSY
ncbi:hypothetical protein V5094_05455 [Moellerella wisconsensis]|uniref:hypothetical protein n=1 Tax=Moellerella wisconsensis TaxID=158849 RepID=UPI0030762B4D